ncbi:MAG: DUF2064 domain-containing protein [Elusimicrobia bacterium]|nr:DUF2064 domain-containing protein [Elusimicrobiota bacterium]
MSAFKEIFARHSFFKLMKDNCLIFIIDAPVSENIRPELKKVFGTERATHIYTDLLNDSYKTAKAVKNTSIIISYKPSGKHPDLTWLDEDDPGFLEAKIKNLNERILSLFNWAFNAGAKKAILLANSSPEVKPEWIEKSFEALNKETVAIGPTDETPYLFGITFDNLDLLEEINFFTGDLTDDIYEKIKKHRLKTQSQPKTYTVKEEETLRQWIELKDASSPLFTQKDLPKEHKKRDKKKNHSDVIP